MSDDGPGTREVAHRLFAAEFDDASLSYSESDEERAPNYVVTPTGARVNRLFVAGVLTEIERVNDQTSRGRVVDPSGAFVTYAGQYQPDEQAFLERADPPAFVALTGKARTFEPEDSDRVFTSVRPESLSEVGADTRDRWVVSAAERTLDRLAVLERALESDLRGEELRGALETGGASASLAAGIPKALAHYDTSPAYVEAVRRMAVDALELIAGERDEVRAPDIAPGDDGDATIGPLPDTDVRIEAAAAGADATTPSESGELEGSDEPDEPDESIETSIGSAEPTDESAEPTDESTLDAGDASSDDSTSSESPPTATLDDGPEDPDAAGSPDGLGDFGGSESLDDDGVDDADDIDVSDPDDPVDSADDDGEPGLGDFDDGGTDEMYELDDEEREEIEAEFGTDFSTGSEVDEPGEADIDVPEPDEPSEDAGDVSDAEPVDNGTTGEDDDAPTEDASPDDVDLEAAAVEEMEARDDGDGADREAVVEAVASEYGVDPEAVEDAVQDALMGGKCYEPGDGLLKAI
ncbi:hypothetical protein [Halorubrum cibi]|uniref:Rpa-associated protein n=1 Tax=Halorubrum cibi TaxID=413815 RepID=A0A521D4S0_9EURY|nr:hypothetical protein [Halorubrum cibi]SMO66667.1 hypothetical protein SAMN06264867_1068 [Halorubrum cibi]